MKPNNWKEVAELIGISAIVASLVFVGLQMRQAELIARSEMQASFQANSIEMNNAIIAHPDIWLRGNAGEDLDQDEAIIFSHQVYNINNAYYFAVQQFRILGDDEAAEIDSASFAGYLFENPGARRVWSEREAFYEKYRGTIVPRERITSDWVNAINSNLAVFEDAESH